MGLKAGDISYQYHFIFYHTLSQHHENVAIMLKDASVA